MKHRLLLFSGLLVFLALGWPTFAGLQQVSGLFGEARYDEARQSLVGAGEGAQPGEETLWRARLSQDPDQATVLLQSGIDDPSLPESTRVGMAMQLAQIHFSRKQYQEAHLILTALHENSTQTMPGEVYLLSGLTYRAAGQTQKAREMLASVKPGDQAFGAARYFLGDIGLENNDPELALRYFESGQKNANVHEYSRLKAGQWKALRANGQDQAAQNLLDELKAESAGCLALVEIGRVLQQENDDNSARIASASSAVVDTVVSSPDETAGRYALQLGAFSDRGLALEFQRAHQNQVPGLEISEVRDSMGQFMYKLRFGSFNNPALARSEAQRQKKKLNLDVIVVELDSSADLRR